MNGDCAAEMVDRPDRPTCIGPLKAYSNLDQEGGWTRRELQLMDEAFCTVMYKAHQNKKSEGSSECYSISTQEPYSPNPTHPKRCKGGLPRGSATLRTGRLNGRTPTRNEV